MTNPITVERFTKELEKLNEEMRSGKLGHGEYDQRLAAVIGELRERGIDADRPTINAALDGALERGIITPAVKNHLIKRLGLT